MTTAPSPTFADGMEGRLLLAIDRVSRALDVADYDGGHIITSDNVRINDVRVLLAAAIRAAKVEEE
jgi:hypothetical protein